MNERMNEERKIEWLDGNHQQSNNRVSLINKGVCGMVVTFWSINLNG
jgi:hypothetical protein